MNRYAKPFPCRNCGLGMEIISQETVPPKLIKYVEYKCVRCCSGITLVNKNMMIDPGYCLIGLDWLAECAIIDVREFTERFAHADGEEPSRKEFWRKKLFRVTDTMQVIAVDLDSAVKEITADQP